MLDQLAVEADNDVQHHLSRNGMHTPEHHYQANKDPSSHCRSFHDSAPALPRPPSPSADRGIAPVVDAASNESGDIPKGVDLDIFTLSPTAALKMLCGTVEALVKITGDVPPTPVNPPDSPKSQIVQIPQISQAVQENETRHTQTPCRDRPPTPYMKEAEEPREPTPPSTEEENHSDPKDVPARAKTPIGSPEAHPAEGLHIIGSNMEPLNVQHSAITRKFYSKKPPPIPLEEYLLRLHQYCPMSTGVYLATSLYIHRLAIIEKILPVTARNVHRLLLAGLRVAMKALEDLSYPHRRFAKVGGVSEPELARLEVSFCFVANFELKVTSEMLLAHALAIRDGLKLVEVTKDFQPKLPSLRNLPLRRPSMAATKAMKNEAPAAARELPLQVS